MDNGNLSKSNEAVSRNPYLSAPIRFAEEDTSPATTLSEKPSCDIDEGNALEMKQNTNRNIITAEISGPPSDMVSGKLGSSHDEKLFSCQIPCLRFKIKIGKKTNVSSRIAGHWFLDDSTQFIGEGDVSNDVKGRAQKILKESMENTQDVGLDLGKEHMAVEFDVVLSNESFHD
ncbi:hypothetical protein MLD38_000227 [Melastoma candidum]|nr:hypothetical protein MLD38_000227 [Melastoma candidum]